MSLIAELQPSLGGNGRKPGAVEAAMNNGGLPPEGVHHATLNGCREVTAHTGTTGRELVFKILAGEGAGLEVKDTLWNSDNELSINRKLLFAHRLGVLKKVGAGDSAVYEAVPGKDDINDVLGTVVFIEVKHEEYDKKTGGKGKSARLSFEGIINPDDKRVKGVPVGTAPPRFAMSPQSAAPLPPRQKTIDEADMI